MESFLYGFDPTIEEPLVEQYFLLNDDFTHPDTDTRQGSWTPYPIVLPLQPALLATLLHAQCALARIFHDILRTLRPSKRATDDSQTSIDIKELYGRLLLWEERLDPRLKLRGDFVGHAYHLMSVFPRFSVTSTAS
jgi:hypothetical protein